MTYNVLRKGGLQMNKIKELRKEDNITVAELAKELGISQSMLTNYTQSLSKLQFNRTQMI